MRLRSSVEHDIPFVKEQTTEEETLRRRIPDLEPFLLPHEIVINVEYPKIVKPTSRISVIKALHKIANADSSKGVGESGPIVASAPIESSQSREDLRLYEVMFGRDSLRVSLDLLDRYPKLAHSTIVKLAELQGRTFNPRNGEEPGRIIHELRNPATDELARKLSEQRGWEWPYYESIDATPMFITAVKRYCKQEGGELLAERYPDVDGVEHSVSDYFQNSVRWLIRRLDASTRGLLESHRKMGIDPESWKDSGDAFSHSNGEIANLERDIAPLEVQVLAYDALIDAAAVYEKQLDGAEESRMLQERASVLREKIMDWFWVDDESHHGGYFCIGLDYDRSGNSRQLQIRTSDMGHLLNSRLLDGDNYETTIKRESIIRNLFSPEMLNASGIRTLASNENRFIPVGYHTGSVWLWDTYYIAQGLERQGYYGLSEVLKERIIGVTAATNLLPEFVEGGYDSEPKLNERIVDVWDPEALDRTWDGERIVLVRGRVNRLEQPPQEIQAWTVAAILASKYKRDPLHPERAVPTRAIDEKKLELENEILEDLTARTDS